MVRSFLKEGGRINTKFVANDSTICLKHMFLNEYHDTHIHIHSCNNEENDKCENGNVIKYIVLFNKLFVKVNQVLKH
jgi:hypothetical protein